VGRVELLLGRRRQTAAVVIVDLQAERLRPTRHRLTDAPHADDAEPFPPDAVTEHPGRAPAAPFTIAGEYLRAFGEPAWHRQDQCHGHIGGVFGQHAGRIGHRDAALHRRRHVDIIDTVAEIGDEF
jgi:hypothetical protein